MPLEQGFIDEITGPGASEFLDRNWSGLDPFSQNQAFCLVAEEGRLDLLNILVEKTPEHRRGGMIHANFDNSFTSAAKNGHIPIVKRLLELTPADTDRNLWLRNKMIHTDSEFYDTRDVAFRLAASNGHLNVVNLLITETPDPNIRKMMIHVALVLEGNSLRRDVLQRLQEESRALDLENSPESEDPVEPAGAIIPQPQVAIQAAGAAYVAPEANPSQLQVVAVPPAGVGAVDVALDPQPQVAERPNPNPITLFASRLVRLFTQCFTRNNDSRVAPGGENAEAARGEVGRGNRVHPIDGGGRGER